MNLINDAEKIKSDFEEYKNLSEKGEEAETFEQFASLLEPIKEGLEELKEPLGIMMDSEEIQISHKFNSFKELSKKIKILNDLYTKSSKKAVLEASKEKDVHHYLIEPLNQFVDDIESILKAEWASWIRKNDSSAMNEETLEVLTVAGLEGVADFKINIDKMKNLLNELPKEKGDLDEVKILGDAIRSAWKNLDAPVEIINFLKEANEEGASLDLLSENVKKWLKEKKLIKKFKVKISSGRAITQTIRYH